MEANVVMLQIYVSPAQQKFYKWKGVDALFCTLCSDFSVTLLGSQFFACFESGTVSHNFVVGFMLRFAWSLSYFNSRKHQLLCTEKLK